MEGPLVVPAPVVVELDWLASSRLGVAPFAAFVDDILERAVEIADLVRDDYVRIGELLHTYADLKLGFVDASVMAVVERLREPKLATLDLRHFTAMRPRHVSTLTLLPN
jgi:predicted nucleic acid-binding protein